MKASFLLPRGLRPLGLISLSVGLILLIVRFYFGIKPEFLEVRVFAVYSVYLDAKVMSVIQNQVSEELGGLLVLIGLMIAAFTSEKIENDQVNVARLGAFFVSAYTTFVFLAFAIIFTYGLGFAFMMMINMMLGLVIYIVVFRLRLNKLRTKQVSLT